MYKDLFFVTSLSRLYFDIMELQPIQIETLNIFFNQNVKSAATIYHILLCSIYDIPRSFYYLLFGRRITSPFFCSLSNTLEQLHSSGKNVSTLISFLHSNGLRLITNFLWMTLLLYLDYYYPIRDIMNHP